MSSCRQWRSTYPVTHARLIAKMSYTNIGFAFVPKNSRLNAARHLRRRTGYQGRRNNLQRVLARRRVITQTGTIAQSGFKAVAARRR